MDLKLKDKVVLIIGATGDSGIACTQAFAKEGCKLALTSTSQEKLDTLILPKLGDVAPENLATFVTDITKEDEVKEMVAGVEAKYGRIDILMTCSGYLPERTMLTEASYDEFQKTIDINFYGILWVMKYVEPVMAKNKYGVMVVMASNGSFLGCGGGLTPYAVAKAAEASLCKSAAMEFAPDGVRVNYICPGGLDTKMLRRTAAAAAPGVPFEDVKALWAQGQLNKRLCTVDDVAAAALFLASDVSGNIDATCFEMDGGLAAQRK